jgi:hypothetical protein
MAFPAMSKKAGPREQGHGIDLSQRFVLLDHPASRAQRDEAAPEPGDGSRARAELLKRKWEAWIEFNQPELQGVDLRRSIAPRFPARIKIDIRLSRFLTKETVFQRRSCQASEEFASDHRSI